MTIKIQFIPEGEEPSEPTRVVEVPAYRPDFEAIRAVFLEGKFDVTGNNDKSTT